jgi:SpoVK/Ycf46/Vps4 family AAA+-type ATPase
LIQARPVLPVGHCVGDLPPVARALHVDQRCELYELNVTGDRRQLLLLAPTRGSTAIPSQALEAWWHLQPPNVMSEPRILKSAECPVNMTGGVFTTLGSLLEGETRMEDNPAALTQLCHAVLDLVERTLPNGKFPDLDPSLTIASSDFKSVASLLPQLGALRSEGDLVRLIAAAFYRYASGIDALSAKDGVPPLAQWAKSASKEIAAAVDGSLGPVDPKLRVTTLSRFGTLLGRTKFSATRPDGVKVAAQIGPGGSGLDRVAGMHALKALLRRDVVGPVRDPEPYTRYGLSIPNGILLYGPPGCGKTYIARQLAEELGHYFVEIIPSELASPFVHQSVVRIRELFDDAAEHAPAILFIDEFEALVPQRGELGGHQQHKAEEVNEFLAQLNTCADRGIFVVAATNQPAKIDAAVRRTGRLDKLIYVGPPDLEARAEMLALHLGGRPVVPELKLNQLAKVLQGYSASDIRFLVDEASREAMQSFRDIDENTMRIAMTRIQASVTADVESQYRLIDQRGI